MFSPLDQFETFSLIGFTAPIVGDFYISFTNIGLYSFIVLTIILGLHTLGNNNFALVPSSYSIALETLFATISTIVRNQIGETKEVYIPFIYSLFLFILISNLTSNVPYNFAITSSIIVCLSLSVTIFIGVTILAIVKHGVKYFSFFLPQGTPTGLVPLLVLIELVSNLARSVSLGLRLFANLCKMFSSSVLMSVVTLLPFTVFIGIIGLEIAVSFIQAYVFVLLTASYIKDAEYLH
jgi:F-type H+-transporting ATPase subunit a